MLVSFQDLKRLWRVAWALLALPLLPLTGPAATTTPVSVVPTLAYTVCPYDAGSVSVVSDNAFTGLEATTQPVASICRLVELLVAKTPAKFDVGIYDEIRGAPGLDAHHVGQKTVMQDFIPGYDPATATSILVAKVFHTMFLISVPKQLLIPEKAFFVYFSA